MDQQGREIKNNLHSWKYSFKLFLFTALSEGHIFMVTSYILCQWVEKLTKLTIRGRIFMLHYDAHTHKQHNCNNNFLGCVHIHTQTHIHTCMERRAKVNHQKRQSYLKQVRYTHTPTVYIQYTVDSFEIPEKSRRKEKKGKVQLIPHTVNRICDDRCGWLHSVASNSTMTWRLDISTFTVWHHRTSVHINGGALAFDDL